MSDLDELRRQIEKLSGMIKINDQPPVTFGEFAQKYLMTKLQNPTLRESTKKCFENQIKNHLIPTFGNFPLSRVNNIEFLYWINDVRKSIEPKITRFFNARKYLIQVLLAAKEEGLIEKVPKFDNPDEEQDTGRSLKPREILRILKNTKDRFFRFVFYVFWKMGCRPREILQWEWTMFEWGEPDHTWISIPGRITKTKRSRRIPVNPNVSRRLFQRYTQMMREGREGCVFVFPSRQDSGRPELQYHRAWAESCRLAGIQAVAYDLRRTFITQCAAEGKPLIYVAKILDTSTQLIESTYAKIQSEVMEDLVK